MAEKLQPCFKVAHSSRQISFIASEPLQQDSDEAGLWSAPTSAITKEVSVRHKARFWSTVMVQDYSTEAALLTCVF